MVSRRPVQLVLGVAAVALLASFVLDNHGPTLSPYRASWTLTPGALNPDVTPATIADTICKSGWTSSIRPPSDYTDELKLEQMQVYHRTGGPSDYQEDHLISLELGGDPADPRNLWPEPREQAEAVDQTENDLNDAICSGRISLREGQERISEIKHTEG